MGVATDDRQSEFGRAVERTWKGTIARLSRDTGIEYDRLHRIVRRGFTPDMDELVKIAEHLGVTVDSLARPAVSE